MDCGFRKMGNIADVAPERMKSLVMNNPPQNQHLFHDHHKNVFDVECMRIPNGLSPSAREVKIQCTDKQRQALLMVKQSLIDDYGQLSSWGNEDGKKDYCLWRGVRCNNRTRHVVLLDLINPWTFDHNLKKHNPLRDCSVLTS
ncbi:Leucine-rich repeat-containing N-terminal [Theobroma cacao]|nr:Leucine-rich repeat-containing N-terminal [Theobroma cacao]